MARSTIPDLIFDNVLKKRSDLASRLYRGKDIHKKNIPLDRVTLFVTHRCNFRCSYCNGPHLKKDLALETRRQMLKSDFTLPLFEKLLKDWEAAGLKHIHFTGGEATLNKDLPEFMRLASARRIDISLTTNGYADIGLYRKLVQNGLRELRISIDFMDPVKYGRLTGVADAFHRVTDNISALAEMRDSRYKDLFIILNACVTRFDVDGIRTNLAKFITLKADDIKLLTVPEINNDARKSVTREHVEELLEFSHLFKPDGELLDRKIHTLFRSHATGLKDHLSRNAMHHCFIPLTERTLDARGYWPCSIYLRYTGKKIIGIDSSFEEQKLSILDFISEHDCRGDEICIANCTNCCKKFNIECNKRLSKELQLSMAASRKVTLIRNISDTEIDSIIADHNKIIARWSIEHHPFLIIKPSGLKLHDELMTYLSEQKVQVTGEREISDWYRTGLLIYLNKLDRAYVAAKIAKNRALMECNEKSYALLVLLRKNTTTEKLSRIKKEVRFWAPGPMLYYKYLYNKKWSGIEMVKTSDLHVPDIESLTYESNVINYFLR